jgi:hypothetical protein
LNLSPEKRYRRFFLGIANEEEQCRIEEEVLTGEVDDFFLQNTEDELIDDYLLGSMTQEERQGFSMSFLSTKERRQRLAFAAGLIEYARKQQAEELSTSWKLAQRSTIRAVLSWKRAALLAATASVLFGVLAGLELMKLRDQTQVAQETRNELTRLQATLAADNRRAAQVAGPSTGILSGTEDAVDRMPVIEFASTTRSMYPVVFRVPANARFARIDWKLSAPLAEKYREVLLSGSGQQLWVQEFPAVVLSPANRSTIVLPASILSPGTYHFRLDMVSTSGGFEELADCVFRVVRE